MKLTKFQGLMLIVSETGMEAGQPDEGRSARGRRVMWVICSPHGSHCQPTFNSASISLRFSMWRLVYNSTFQKTDRPHFPPHKVCRKPRLPVDVGTMTLFRILPFTERYFAGNSDRSFALSAERERLLRLQGGRMKDGKEVRPLLLWFLTQTRSGEKGGA